MKKNTILFSLFAAVLCGFSAPAAAADFCGQNYNDCCEWSMLDGKVTLGADWLYWKVQQDGMFSGVSASGTTEGETTLITTRRHRPNFQWENGFRVNLGYELPCDSWDVNLSYTYMPGKGNGRAVISESDFTFTPPPGLAAFAEAFAPGTIAGFASKWNLTANNIDLDFGRTVSFGENFNVRPHVGFRTTWFDQTHRNFIAFNVVQGDPVVASAITMKEKFQGYGVEAGLWSDYRLGCGLSLVGHFGGSILYSEFKIHRTAVVTTTLDTVETINLVINDSEKFFTATPSLDYFVGLQYADTMCDMIVKARLGWEQHVLFDTNRMLFAGNLSTQGLTLGLDVGF